jgi:hypothetical protein
MKDRVVFETNVPVTAALAYPDGIKVEGRFGDQVMYSLSDERVMYVPPVVRDKLVEIGIQQHESFSICKAERRNGNRRFIEWVVKRLESEQPGVHKAGNGDESRPVETSPPTDNAASCVAGRRPITCGSKSSETGRPQLADAPAPRTNTREIDGFEDFFICCWFGVSPDAEKRLQST